MFQIQQLVDGPCADEESALERLEAVLKPIMWRNDKASVRDELTLPDRLVDVRSTSVALIVLPDEVASESTIGAFMFRSTVPAATKP